MPKIAFFDTKPYDRESFDRVNGEYGYEIKFFKEHLNRDTAVLAEGFDTVCAFVNDTLDRETVDILHARGVCLIALRCAGYNNVDLQAVFGRIHVARVPAYSPHAVAEHALALLLTLNRKTHRAYFRTRDNNFTISGLMGMDLHGKTAGVIGTGKIGQILAGILKGLGMRVLAYDAFPNKEFAAAGGCEYTDLDTLYRESDVISLHCPLLPETRHMISTDSIEKMKDGVILINTSRGQLIDTKALIKALKKKKIGAAGLDVYEEESEYFFEDHSDAGVSDDTLARLLTFNNVLVTSHQAFFTKEALHNIAVTTMENIKAFAEDRDMENEICYKCDAKPCPKKNGGKCF